jgi:hypothetical protein
MDSGLVVAAHVYALVDVDVSAIDVHVPSVPPVMVVVVIVDVVVDLVGGPAERECRGRSEEVTGRGAVAGGIGVVVDGIGSGVVGHHRCG